MSGKVHTVYNIQPSATMLAMTKELLGSNATDAKEDAQTILFVCTHSDYKVIREQIAEYKQRVAVLILYPKGAKCPSISFVDYSELIGDRTTGRTFYLHSLEHNPDSVPDFTKQAWGVEQIRQFLFWPDGIPEGEKLLRNAAVRKSKSL